MAQLTSEHEEELSPLSWPSIPIPREFPVGKRMAPLRENDVARFMRLVRREGSCIRWQGYCGTNGYGYYGLTCQITVLAHRFAYIIWRGAIPGDLPHLDHLCRNRACVDPWSLDPVTRSINLLRSPLVRAPSTENHRNAVKTHCPQGHPYDEVNTYVDGVGGRHCKICRAVAGAKRNRSSRPTPASTDEVITAYEAGQEDQG